jgi:hypothetical protein
MSWFHCHDSVAQCSFNQASAACVKGTIIPIPDAQLALASGSGIGPLFSDSDFILVMISSQIAL